ncbi:CFEM domain-containing protein [Paraphaeosphaeria sporulosa]
MKWATFFAGCALFAPMVAGAMQTELTPRQSVDIPVCMKQCEDVGSSTCFQQFGQGKITCECRAALDSSAAQACLQKSCKPKDIFTTLNAVASACNEPLRDKGTSYRTICIVFFTLASIAVVGRFATHFTVGRTNLLDNANIGLGYLLNVVLFACCMKMSYLGLGRDMWTLEDDTITTTLLYFWVSEYVYFGSIGLIKTSFLIFFLQIFPLKSFRRIVWICITVNLTATFACAIAAVFVCSPITFAWTQWDGEHQGKCVSNNDLAFAHAGIGIVMDFITLALPISQIWNLHMSSKKKIGVLLMFSVGAFVTIVSLFTLANCTCWWS